MFIWNFLVLLDLSTMDHGRLCQGLCQGSLLASTEDPLSMVDNNLDLVAMVDNKLDLVAMVDNKLGLVAMLDNNLPMEVSLVSAI